MRRKRSGGRGIGWPPRDKVASRLRPNGGLVSLTSGPASPAPSPESSGDDGRHEGDTPRGAPSTSESSGTPAAAGRTEGDVDKPDTAERRAMGLSAKLLTLTILFVMLAEVLIFLPSVANERRKILLDRLTAAKIASLAAEAAPSGQIPPMIAEELLDIAKVRSVAIKKNVERRLVLSTEQQTAIAGFYDLTTSSRFRLIWDALATFFSADDQIILVQGQPNPDRDEFVEIIIEQGPIRKALVRYAFNILVLSVMISIFTASLIYFALNGMLVQPIMRLTRNMLHFGQNPEDASRILVPSGRGDEFGTTERELAQMQTELNQLLHQKSRLAALGLAVSKISHDLRNMLSTAQLISDRFGSIPDPTVQRLAPKLIASLDRAINFCNDTLKFGKAQEATPRREAFPLRVLADDVGQSLGLPREDTVDWRVEIAPDLILEADREQLFRVLSNLCRNAVQAIEGQAPARKGVVSLVAGRDARGIFIEIADDGPGLPEKARAHMFQAFQGSARKGGTGLGLAIAMELIAAHGGTIGFVEVPVGARFRIEIPDRIKAV